MKRIIFFGKTGVGKSSVATMLYQGKLSKDYNPFMISDSAIGCTVDCKRIDSSTWSIYDTIGLGETQDGRVPHDVAKKRIVEFLKNLRVPFNYICIVKKRGRLDQIDPIICSAAREIFAGDTANNIVLIVTDATDEWITTEENSLKEVFGNIPMCAVNFPGVSTDPELEQIYLRRRNESYTKLVSFLNNLNFPANKAKLCYYTDMQIQAVANQIMVYLERAWQILAAISNVSYMVNNLCNIQ